jgi:hypothetical protein
VRQALGVKHHVTAPAVPTRRSSGEPHSPPQHGNALLLRFVVLSSRAQLRAAAHWAYPATPRAGQCGAVCGSTAGDHGGLPPPSCDKATSTRRAHPHDLVPARLLRVDELAAASWSAVSHSQRRSSRSPLGQPARDARPAGSSTSPVEAILQGRAGAGPAWCSTTRRNDRAARAPPNRNGPPGTARAEQPERRAGTVSRNGHRRPPERPGGTPAARPGTARRNRPERHGGTVGEWCPLVT